MKFFMLLLPLVLLFGTLVYEMQPSKIQVTCGSKTYTGASTILPHGYGDVVTTISATYFYYGNHCTLIALQTIGQVKLAAVGTVFGNLYLCEQQNACEAKTNNSFVGKPNSAFTVPYASEYYGAAVPVDTTKSSQATYCAQAAMIFQPQNTAERYTTFARPAERGAICFPATASQ